MSIAKAISLFGSLIYLLIFIAALFYPAQIKEFISQGSLQTSRTVIAITISFAFFLSIANMCYFYYLFLQSKNGEVVPSAAFLSLQLVILPIMVLAGIMVIFAL